MKKKSFKIYAGLFFLFLLSVGLVYLNFFLKVRKINIELFDNEKENVEIQNFIVNYLNKNTNTFFSFITLNEAYVSKIVHDEFQIVSDVQINKKFNMTLDVVVTKNDSFFYTCVPESYNFLISCMMGNSSGIYFKEVGLIPKDTLEVKINPKVLRDVDSEARIEAESLSGSRIYSKADFNVLKEFLSWMKKNGFVVKSINIDELKVVSINTEDYVLKINLDKGFVETVKDFELISKTGALQDYISDKRSEIDYVDLSFKDKVFYKLKKDIENDIMSTTSSSTVVLP